MAYECFSLKPEFVEDKEKLRQLLTDLLKDKAELEEKVTELVGRFESIEAEVKFLLDKQGYEHG